MLVRVVHMHLQKEFLAEASEFLKSYAPNVRSFVGCEFLEISIEENGLVVTYSYWQDSASLEQYRRSTMFRQFWAQVKTWFSEPARAHSFQSLIRLA